MIEAIGWVITVIAVWGVVLNNQRRRECFYLWLVSNGLSAGVHLWAGMWAMATRDAIFFSLAIMGLRAWRQHDSI
jgi:nicotinamide riboside transporter PnuC